MHLAVSGHPLHSRALSVTLSRGTVPVGTGDCPPSPKIDVAGSILDLRKRGFVPVAGDLQASGVVHDMHLAAIVDPDTGVLESLVGSQPRVAFEASALSKGETCRDPIDRVQSLAGVRLDGEYPRQLAAAIGGPRGCSHILALAQLLGSTVPWALGEAGGRRHRPGEFAPGERIFRRDMVIDGHEEESKRRVQMAVQLTDLHFAPAPPVSRPMDRFAAGLELRLLAIVDAARFSLVEATAAGRRRTFDDLEHAEWEDLSAALEGLAGTKLGSGVSGRFREVLGEREADRPLLDALLMLTPAFFQCVGAMSENWPVEAKQSRSLMGTGGFPDSCYIWRRGGALTTLIEEELASGVFKPKRR